MVLHMVTHMCVSVLSLEHSCFGYLASGSVVRVSCHCLDSELSSHAYVQHGDFFVDFEDEFLWIPLTWWHDVTVKISDYSDFVCSKSTHLPNS